MITNRGFINLIQKCESSCLACSSETECSKCIKDYHLFGNKCLKICETGYYQDNEKCVKCPYPCEKCINSTNCLNCAENKILFDSKCLDHCPDNYYKEGKICKACHPSCKTCNSDSKISCITCNDGFSFKNGQCESNCAEGTFFDKAEGLCALCNTSICSTCISSPNTCIKCIDSFALDLKSQNCKPCCSRSLRGKTKYPACCNCDDSNPPMCLSESDRSESDDNVKKLSIYNVYIIMLFIFSIIFVSISLIYFLKSFKIFSKISFSKAGEFKNVEYTALDEF